MQVMLFDEIEKAHPDVLRLFLQILGSGRLTDGRGETVFFSECVIIFTSNCGAADAKQRRFGSRQELEEYFRAAVEAYFVEQLGMPELLGRIGMDHIIVFNPITDPEVQREIIVGELNAVTRALGRKYPDFSFEWDASVPEYFLCSHRFDELGARGMAKRLEHVVGTVMARCLVNNRPGVYALSAEGGEIVLTQSARGGAWVH
jgi:ATP-dependent Clp protease ATP-binding subunit ClpA